MPKYRAPINSEPVNKQARSDIHSLLEDYKLASCVEHVKRFARLSVGKRGTIAWLEHLRLVGTLLATLGDEEWQLLCVEVTKPQDSVFVPSPKSVRPSPSTSSTDVEPGLF